MATLVFYTIASVAHDGYNIVQRGSDIVLAKKNLDNPFQLWYMDESWGYLEDAKTKDPIFALVNNGSKAALKAKDDGTPASKFSRVCTDYKPSSEADVDGGTTLWSSHSCEDGTMTISSFAFRGQNLYQLGVRNSSSSTESVNAADMAVILQKARHDTGSTQRWQFIKYEPSAYYRIQTQWFSQILITKKPHENVTFAGTIANRTFNDELTVVAVHPSNQKVDQAVWYKVPAGGSNSSFIVISKFEAGKALKGSTMPGDKVIVADFDPFDDNFVWSENRTFSLGTEYVAINLANGDNTLHWHVPNDSEYQNSAFYHPLIVRATTSAQQQNQWHFIPS